MCVVVKRQVIIFCSSSEPKAYKMRTVVTVRYNVQCIVVEHNYRFEFKILI